MGSVCTLHTVTRADQESQSKLQQGEHFRNGEEKTAQALGLGASQHSIGQNLLITSHPLECALQLLKQSGAEGCSSKLGLNWRRRGDAQTSVTVHDVINYSPQYWLTWLNDSQWHTPHYLLYNLPCSGENGQIYEEEVKNLVFSLSFWPDVVLFAGYPRKQLETSPPEFVAC